MPVYFCLCSGVLFFSKELGLDLQKMCLDPDGNILILEERGKTTNSISLQSTKWNTPFSNRKGLG